MNNKPMYNVNINHWRRMQTEYGKQLGWTECWCPSNSASLCSAYTQYYVVNIFNVYTISADDIEHISHSIIYKQIQTAIEQK